MNANHTANPDQLTSEELARVQMAIDAGTIWATPDGGQFAKRLIEAGKCKLPPGVYGLLPTGNGRYEPIYSKEAFDQRTSVILEQARHAASRWARARAELTFLREHRDDLLRLHGEEILTRPLLPWRRARHEQEALAKVNALRAKAGLPPRSLQQVRALRGEFAGEEYAQWRELVAKYEKQGAADPYFMAGWEASANGIPVPWEVL